VILACDKIQTMMEQPRSFIVTMVAAISSVAFPEAKVVAFPMIRLPETNHRNDQLAALAWLRKQDFVQRKRIAALGIEGILGPERNSYCAVIDAWGGAESWSRSGDLQSFMKRAVRSFQAATFFLQAESDYDLSLSRVLSAEMTSAGKISEVKIYPPFGTSAREEHSFA
jgi:hypothetical protein